ncbi:hypothetical protein [Aquimarina sp. SS2-1]|uniref:hypothetical protein n=1 Tax=Aquimarina besae TaxID=3342247 RepID=UPI00366CC82D
MKQIILFIAIATLTLSCSKDSIDSIEEVNQNKELKTYSYVYQGNRYDLKIDFSDPDQPELQPGEHNEFMEKVFDLPNLVTIITDDNDHIYHLFDDMEAYKNSDFKKELNNNPTDTDTDRSSNIGADVKLFWDINYGGSSISYSAFSYTEISNLHEIGWGDKVSSIEVNGYNAEFYFYEDTRFRGKVIGTVHGTYPYAPTTSYWRDLRRNKMNSTPWSRSWNDRISSLIIIKR